MDSARPLLTICLPTWNRSQQLKKGVVQIAEQVLCSGYNVEIFISDNASTDETSLTVADLARMYPFVRHSRNATNLGADRNFLAAISGASGEYVWLCSDDDLLADGAIRKICEIIEEYRPCHISTNHRWFSEGEGSECRQPPSDTMVTEDSPNVDINRVFSVRGEPFSFMGSHIFMKALLDVPQYEENLPNAKHFIHIYMAAHVIGTRRCAYLSSFYAVNARIGHGREHPSVFLLDQPDAFRFALTKFGAHPSTTRSVLDGMRKNLLKPLSFMKFRAQGVKISTAFDYPLYYRLLPPIPPPLLTLVLKLKRTIRPAF